MVANIKTTSVERYFYTKWATVHDCKKCDYSRGDQLKSYKEKL